MSRTRGSGSGWATKEGGIWVGRWRDYSTGNVKTIRRNIGPVKEFSEREAKKQLAQLIRDFTPSATMLFSAAAVRYIEVRGSGWGKNAKSAIESTFNRQVNPRIGHLRVGEIKPTHVQLCLNQIAAAMSDSYVKKAQMHIGGVLAMLEGDDIVKKNAGRNPNVRKPITRATDKTYLKLEETISLISCVRNERDRLILMIFLECGFRPSETFALRLNDLRDGNLFVDEVATPNEKPRKKGKTEESFTGVPVSQDLDLELRLYAMKEMIQLDELLFPTEIGTPMDYNRWRKRHLAPMAKAAGLKRVTHQILRRTVGTLVQELKCTPKDIQSLLRHKDIATTLGIYQQPMAKTVRAMVDQWSEALRGKAN